MSPNCEILKNRSPCFRDFIKVLQRKISLKLENGGIYWLGKLLFFKTIKAVYMPF